MAFTQGMKTSTTDEWETPQDLFDFLNEGFAFELDAAATPENAKCARFYTRADNALELPWEGSVWCNPPYGRAIGDFVRKGALEGQKTGNTVVMLLPARTDTEWWHEWVQNYATDIAFIRGRLKFGDSVAGAPFPSVVVIFCSWKTERCSLRWTITLKPKPAWHATNGVWEKGDR